jgi:uncharacterized SAM-binding protein YcdF (DUF218 family)
VTSGQHMPRAVRTFNKVWANSALKFTPSVADVQITRRHLTWELCIPSPNALLSVSTAIKEIAGIVALAMI